MASISVRPSIFRIQAGRAPLAVASQPAAGIVNTAPHRAIRSLRETLGHDFKVHSLRADVVRNVFTRYRQPVYARNHLFRNHKLPGVRARTRLPFQSDTNDAFQPSPP